MATSMNTITILTTDGRELNFPTVDATVEAADGLLEGVRTLTGNIVMEMGYAQGLHREALIATGVVLFVFILIINLLFSILKRKESKA